MLALPIPRHRAFSKTSGSLAARLLHRALHSALHVPPASVTLSLRHPQINGPRAPPRLRTAARIQSNTHVQPLTLWPWFWAAATQAEKTWADAASLTQVRLQAQSRKVATATAAVALLPPVSDWDSLRSQVRHHIANAGLTGWQRRVAVAKSCRSQQAGDRLRAKPAAHSQLLVEVPVWRRFTGTWRHGCIFTGKFARSGP